MGSNVDNFLRNLGMPDDKDNSSQTKADLWDKVIQPASSYLILGDVDTGKSGLAYWLLERFSKKYSLLPAVVGFPHEKKHLLPDGFAIPSGPSECIGLEDAIVFIDEADLQLPIEDTKARKYVVNFLSLPQHRNQIFLLAFHFPRLALGRYLPFFSGFLLKRPPYLIEFAGKRRGDELTRMMAKAEERFSELPSPDEVVKHTYIVAPRIRWQGMVTNPLPSFWSTELRRAWSGVGLREAIPPGQTKMPFKVELSEMPAKERLNLEIGHLFPEGVTDDILDTLIAYDRNYSGEELARMCSEAGLNPRGHKKLLAARLIAAQREKK
jgi:hypothetical protein